MESSVDRYLFVKSGGFPYWSIRSSLDDDKFFISSGSIGESCPAHPSNFSFSNKYKYRHDNHEIDWTHHQSTNVNNWGFNKDRMFEEEGVVVRCSVHDADHGQWLVEQGREGNMEKEEVQVQHGFASLDLDLTSLDLVGVFGGSPRATPLKSNSVKYSEAKPSWTSI